MMLLMGLGGAVQAQYAVSIATVNPGTTGNGPMGSGANHVSEHIYLASEIGTDMNITQIGFSMNALTGLPRTYNSVSIYLQTTANTTFVAGTYSLAGYTLVYNGSMTFSTTGFTSVTLTTPFNYTTGAGNLQMMVVRTDNVAAAGPVMNSANGNATLGGTANTCRRFNGATPVIGSTALAVTPFRAAVKFSGTAGPCATITDFNQTSWHCYEPGPAYNLVQRGAPNGFAVAGTGSVLLNFYNVAAATTTSLTSPTFVPYGVTKQINFDVAGATYPSNAPDQLFVEGSTDGGTTWTVPIATLDNGVLGALNPTGLSITGGYAPTTAAEWATRSFTFPGSVNRIRWRAISQFGNQVYLDNFTVTDPPACPTPTAVAISNVTGFNADVSWTCAGCTGQYYVEYGAPGFVPGTTAAAGGGTVVGPFAGTSTTLTVPAGRTNYEVRVRQDCGGGIFSANTAAASFLSGCGANLSCDYTFHLTDNFGDGWNNASIQVQEEGLTVATLTMNAPPDDGCEKTVTIELCHDSALALICTNAGDFPDEPGLRITDPFGGIVYEFRGPTFYAGNCAVNYPTPAVPANLAVGTIHGSTVDCVQDPCIDPPTAGTLTADAATICSNGGTVNLSYSGGTNGLGQTIVWESSPDGIVWSPIPAANGLLNYSDSPTDTTYYHVVITCGLNSATSNSVMVAANSFACYCIAAHPPGCGNGNIVNVTLGSLNNTTTCNPPAYQAFPPATGTTTTVQQGVSYLLNVTSDNNCIISVWVDWDHDNVYEASEWTQVTTSSTVNVAATVGLQVPLTATLGATNMRIRTRFSGNANGPTDACTSMGSGETEDYIITVDPAPPCLPATAVTISNVSATSFVVNWTNALNSCGTTTYSIEYGPDGFTPGTGTIAGPFTAGPQTIGGLTASTVYDVYVTRDCNSCGDGVSASSLASATTFPDCAEAQAINCPFGEGTFGANFQGAWTFTEPLFNFQTVGAEQLFFLDANVLGTYTMQLTANAGNSIVAIYIKPVGGPCDATGWTYVGTNQFTIQTFTFPIAATGQYYVLVDPVSSSLDISTYLVSFVCPPQNVDCANAQTVSCGQNFLSTTVGQANTLPVNACPFPTSPSTGGSLWYTYTAPADQEVTFSTCSNQSFDTRISVFTGADCDNLSCVALNDDGVGCPNFSSEVAFPAQAGVTYYVAIHGFGASEGIFQLAVLCGAPCAPAISNDLCSSATVLTPALDDGNGVPTAADNTCAYGDLNTSCDPFGSMQGLWYSFNSGPNSIMFLDLTLGTATGLNYALYDGGCDGLGALGEVDCVIDGAGTGTQLSLTPNTDYLLYVWNDGGVSNEGSFNVLLRAPGMNDAGIEAITAPAGTLCSSVITPTVTLKNFGENALTSVNIVYDIDGGTPQVYAWTGNLAYLATESVTLPPISTTLGLHTLNVTVDLPNGAADEIAGNDAASAGLDISGETVVVSILTDNNGGETSWTIFDAFFFPVANGGPYAGQNNTEVNTTVCLQTGLGNCFSFIVTDAGGDGLCCLNGNGRWELRNVSGRVLLRDRFEGGNQSPSTTPVSPGYFAHDFCVPAGPSGILATECDIFTNTLQSKVYTQTVGGVLNYQFEFSDPDGGFRRRIAVPRNWVAFGEMVTSPLTPGTVYFARVRVDQGATGFADDRFGTGCEMAIDPSSIGCPQLIDNISLPTHSCGVTRAFGGSDKIWSVPTYGATQYRFRFSGGLIDSDGPTGPNAPAAGTRTILRPSYVCLLNWATFTLVNGQTYSVTVEALVNGVWTGFCGPACNVTISNPPAFAGRAMEVDAEPVSSAFMMYPNPNRGEQLFVSLSNITADVNVVTVDLYDMFGKRVLTATLPVQDGQLQNNAIALDREIAAGLYLVNVTAGGYTTTERLVIQR